MVTYVDVCVCANTYIQTTYVCARAWSCINQSSKLSTHAATYGIVCPTSSGQYIATLSINNRRRGTDDGVIYMVLGAVSELLKYLGRRQDEEMAARKATRASIESTFTKKETRIDILETTLDAIMFNA